MRTWKLLWASTSSGFRPGNTGSGSSNVFGKSIAYAIVAPLLPCSFFIVARPDLLVGCRERKRSEHRATWLAGASD